MITPTPQIWIFRYKKRLKNNVFIIQQIVLKLKFIFLQSS